MDNDIKIDTNMIQSIIFTGKEMYFKIESLKKKYNITGSEERYVILNEKFSKYIVNSVNDIKYKDKKRKFLKTNDVLIIYYV